MRINWRLIRYIFGVLLIMESVFMVLTSMVALYYHHTQGDDDWQAFMIVALLTFSLGATCWGTSRRHSRQITTREGFLVVAMAWIVFSLLGMLPLLMTGACPTLSKAFLEAMSGFTTTGCTTIDNLDMLPHGVLFWRHTMQWLGGLGIVVFSLALLPLIGTGATQVFSAETNGLSVDKLRPRIDETARRLWGLYVLLTAVCAVLYWVGGMSVFDAVCHSFSTLASGGFSTHQDSIGYFHSPFIEYVCIAFLFITSINFNLFYFMARGQFRLTLRNEELRWFSAFVVGFTLLFMGLDALTRNYDLIPVADQALLGDGSLENSLRTALFHTLTIISSAGFQSEHFDYVAWGSIFWLPTLLLMATGGCSSSTAGGLKMVRILVLIKNARNQFLHALMPRSYSTVRLDGHALSSDVVFKILAMLSIYLILMVTSVFILQTMGLSFDTAIGGAVSALGNTGPALGTIGPSFTWSSLPPQAMWYLSFMMLVGRLEIFTVIVIFTPMFWKK